jgi:ATP-dependent Clp protease ATP-binding subunit ClpC
MESPIDRFTPGARAAMRYAREEAGRFNHHYIGTEHELLGLLREDEGVAAAVLAGVGVELGQVRAAVEAIIGRGGGPAPEEIGLTPRAKKVIELAVDEARQLNHPAIGTEHLLLGLVREGKGVGAGVLQRGGADLAAVRSRVLTAIGATDEPPARGGPA